LYTAASIGTVQPGTFKTSNPPRAELPLNNPPLAPAARSRSFAATLANNVVTALLVVAVLGVLAVNVGPLLLPYHVYTVLSGSMGRTIPVGAEVVLRPVLASQVTTGDIITFTPPGHPGTLVTHRVINVVTDAKGQRFWQTQGDANGVPDVWLLPASGTGWKYWFQVPLLGYLFVMLASPIGRICFIVAPALLLAAVVLNDLWKPRSPAKPSEPGT
jgi:signal peptidase I